jgi:hypothetical protein
MTGWISSNDWQGSKIKCSPSRCNESMLRSGKRPDEICWLPRVNQRRHSSMFISKPWNRIRLTFNNSLCSYSRLHSATVQRPDWRAPSSWTESDDAAPKDFWLDASSMPDHPKTFIEAVRAGPSRGARRRDPFNGWATPVCVQSHCRSPPPAGQLGIADHCCTWVYSNVLMPAWVELPNVLDAHDCCWCDISISFCHSDDRFSKICWKMRWNCT